MKARPDSRARVRRELLEAIAAGLAQDAGTATCFQKSRDWPGYKAVFESWARAFWLWIDGQITPEIEAAWRAQLLAERGRFSPESDFTAPASEEDIERYLQTYLVRRASFLGGLRHRHETDPDWFKAFGFYFWIAQLLGDDLIFTELARLTKRKPSQDRGKRALRYWLLVRWVPACYWAMTNNYIQTNLARRDSSQPSESTGRYSEGRIRNVISELRLVRPSKPLYYGFDRRGELVLLR